MRTLCLLVKVHARHRGAIARLYVCLGGIGEVSCDTSGCVAVLDPFGMATGIALVVGGVLVRSIPAGAGDHHHPTLLRP